LVLDNGISTGKFGEVIPLGNPGYKLEKNIKIGS
jgi:hypothetical protein